MKVTPIKRDVIDFFFSFPIFWSTLNLRRLLSYWLVDIVTTDWLSEYGTHQHCTGSGALELVPNLGKDPMLIKGYAQHFPN